MILYTLRAMSITLVCLHGWGGSKDSFRELRDALKGSHVRILAPDLPGFGNADEPDRPWSVDDYADWAEQYIQEHVDGPYALFGHSHGGRICIKLADRWAASSTSTREPLHIFLCAAAGIRRTRHFKRLLGLLLAKGGKVLLAIPGLRTLQPLAKRLLYKLVRVHDYERASDVMRQTLILVTREDLRPLLKHIRIPTTLFWGKDDSMTPLADGQLMQQRIRGSTLNVYPGVRHGVHRDRAEEIATIVVAALQQ
jgi:pimeloyl-ACP methyl ester carboxylesterase